MIINGGSRSNGAFFAKHLMKTEDNERVTIVEMKGLYGDTLAEGFREMRLLAAGGHVKNPFYHVNINPRENEHLTPEQWELSTDMLENKLGLTDHARMVVEHEKNGRVHRHVVWSRIDPETMTAVSDSFNYLIHTQTARELEQTFNLPPVQLPDPPERDRFKNWETFRAQDSGIDPKAMKAEITALWQQSDGGRAFQAALDEAGYLLAKGDRRDFVLVDPEGDIHSLARRISGAKAADIRAKMTDLDRDSLMTAQEASAFVKSQAREAKAPAHSVSEIEMQEQTTAVADITDQNVGMDKSITPRNIHEFKEAVTDSKRAIATSIEHFAEAVTKTMQANNGELHINDGLTWWQRVTIHLETMGERVMNKARGMWQEFVERFPGNQNRYGHHNFEHER